jgi:RNA polymerase sigma-70 factor (ECF subfamily)
MATLHALTDAELTDLIKSGDGSAFAELYERYHDPIYRFIRKYLRSDELSEDICQNVFIKFWEQREQPVIIREISAWLFTIAKRQALDFLKRASVEQTAMGAILAAYPGNHNTEDDHISKDYLQFIDRVLDSLPEQTKLIFQLCRQQHKSYDEAAELLGISRHTVKKHMMRSMKVLKDAAENELGISFMLLLAILAARS